MKNNKRFLFPFACVCVLASQIIPLITYHKTLKLSSAATTKKRNNSRVFGSGGGGEFECFVICDKRDDLGCKNTHTGKRKQKAFVIFHFINFLVDFCITLTYLFRLGAT
uniref:(northern house mosquito) hypothetical protein n=1 Tax=Culex pipiens TaxID=7175 RepID=A0A8D8C9I1_CULPI